MGFRITGSRSLMPPRGKPGAYHNGHVAGIVQRAILHPLTGFFVAECDTRTVACQTVLARAGSLAKFLSYDFNVALLPRQKQPARFGMEFVSILFEFRGRVSLRIDANGVEEDITTHSIAEQALYLGELGGLHWA